MAWFIYGISTFVGYLSLVLSLRLLETTFYWISNYSNELESSGSSLEKKEKLFIHIGPVLLLSNLLNSLPLNVYEFCFRSVTFYHSYFGKS